MLRISENLDFFKKSIPKNVAILPVTKTKSVEEIFAAYNYGQKDFGENYVQELLEKQKLLPSDIKWHFIGHLQTNKVKLIAPFIEMIHGVDSLKLLKEINLFAKKNNRNIKCLLQVHIALEESKYGLSEAEALFLLNSNELILFKNITIEGIMGMATNTTDVMLIKKEFLHLKDIFEIAKKQMPTIKMLSMGMSSDYKIAIECGGNLIRIGSAIFGERLTK